MNPRTSRQILLLSLLLVVAVSCREPVRGPADPGHIVLTGKVHPEGEWKLDLRGFSAQMNPGDPLDWHVRFTMNGKGLGEALRSVEEVDMIASALRLSDGAGHYREENAYFTSTFLTPSGLPIEGYQYLAPHGKIGGPYRSPLDLVQVVRRDEMKIAGDFVEIEARFRSALAADFPPGVYRVELAPYALVKDRWVKLPVIRGFIEDKCDGAYAEIYYSKALTPPVRIGQPAPPRMIWTLFTRYPNLGVSGVVSREDERDFGISNRVRLSAR